MSKADFRLLRSESGSLVLDVPGNGLRIPYYMTMTLSRDYMLVTAQQAVNLMVWSGGEKHAKRLFPGVEPQPIGPEGGWPGTQV